MKPVKFVINDQNYLNKSREKQENKEENKQENKEENKKLDSLNYIQYKINERKEINNTNKPKKLVENVYYFN